MPFIKMTVTLEDYEVSSYENNKGGVSIVAKYKGHVYNKTRVYNYKDAHRTFDDWTSKFIPKIKVGEGIQCLDAKLINGLKITSKYVPPTHTTKQETGAIQKKSSQKQRKPRTKSSKKKK